MCTNENEVKQLFAEKFNQKFLVNSGVCAYFGNVFNPPVKDGKLSVIKSKLRRILVDFGLCQTSVEIDQRLGFIKVYYRDEQTTELKGLLLQRFNDKEHKASQAIELSISLEGSLVTLPDKEGKIKNYTGLTNLLYQEFIQQIESRSLVDDDPYNQIETIIKQGNLAPTLPFSAILAEGVD